MRTRSAATIDRAREEKKGVDKRKRNGDDLAAGDAGDRIKRCKTQFCAEVAIASQSMARHPLNKKRHNSAGPEKAAGGLSGALRKRRATDRPSHNATGEKSRSSIITRKHGTKVNTVLIQTGQYCDHRDNGVQCQLHEDGHYNVADASLAKGKTEKYKKRGASLGGCLKESIQGGQSGSHAISRKRRLEEQPLSCPRSGKSKCHPGNMRQFKNRGKESIATTPTEVSQQRNSRYSRKRLNAAKSRWKNLAQRILRTKIYPEILTSASEDLTRSIANSKNCKILSLRNKQRKLLAAANASAGDQRTVTGRMRQKVCKQQLSLLKRMKTWLTEANFSQLILSGAKEGNNNDVGEEFIMTEDERYAFAQTMVQSCQKNPNMRTIFLESVRMLTLSGLMQAAASNLLQQGPCEEAQNVMNAWADFKEQSAITKTLPTNLLSAVNQLHEKRGELSTNISMPNAVGICTLSQIGEKTWKFQLPGSSMEDSLLSRSLGQDNPV